MTETLVSTQQVPLNLLCGWQRNLLLVSSCGSKGLVTLIMAFVGSNAEDVSGGPMDLRAWILRESFLCHGIFTFSSITTSQQCIDLTGSIQG